MKPAPTVDTSDDVRAAQPVERALGEASDTLVSTPRRSPRELVASRPDADLIDCPQRPQKPLFFVLLLPGLRSIRSSGDQPRDWPPRTKQPDAAIDTEKPQQPRTGVI